MWLDNAPEGEFKTALQSSPVVCSRSKQKFLILVISRYSCAQNDKAQQV